MLPWSDPAFPQVIDSDFSTNAADITAADDNAVVTLERQAKENEIDTAKKENEVEYKTAEAGGLDQTVTELSSDRDGVQSQYDAIHSSLGGLEKECIAKPETMLNARRVVMPKLLG